jgi:hypothetical protein
MVVGMAQTGKNSVAEVLKSLVLGRPVQISPWALQAIQGLQRHIFSGMAPLQRRAIPKHKTVGQGGIE